MQVDMHLDREINMHVGRWHIGKQADRLTDKQTGKHPNWHAGRQTCRQTGTQAGR